MMTVNGTTYQVVEAKTPHELRHNGKANTATQMVKSGIEQMFTVTKLKGSAIYQVAQYKTGSFGKVVKVA